MLAPDDVHPASAVPRDAQLEPDASTTVVAADEARRHTPPTRVLALAAFGEGALACIGVGWAWSSGYALEMGSVRTGLTLGVATAVGLAVIQYWMLHLAPEQWFISGLRELYRGVLRPLFGRLSFVEIVAISALAGIGEELLFRGAMQPAWGWVASSVLFGLCHVAGRATWPLGLWAGVVGLWLGWLAVFTGGLLAPIVAHAVYDALALSYIRWGRDT